MVTPELDERLLGLLAQHYDLAVAGEGRCVGRAAHVVEARRPGVAGAGAVAGRFWLDAASGLVLRREVYDARGERLRSSAFVELSVQAPTAVARPAAALRTDPDAGAARLGLASAPVAARGAWSCSTPGSARTAVARSCTWRTATACPRSRCSPSTGPCRTAPARASPPRGCAAPRAWVQPAAARARGVGGRRPGLHARQRRRARHGPGGRGRAPARPRAACGACSAGWAAAWPVSATGSTPSESAPPPYAHHTRSWAHSSYAALTRREDPRRTRERPPQQRARDRHRARRRHPAARALVVEPGRCLGRADGGRRAGRPPVRRPGPAALRRGRALALAAPPRPSGRARPPRRRPRSRARPRPSRSSRRTARPRTGSTATGRALARATAAGLRQRGRLRPGRLRLGRQSGCGQGPAQGPSQGPGSDTLQGGPERVAATPSPRPAPTASRRRGRGVPPVDSAGRSGGRGRRGLGVAAAVLATALVAGGVGGLVGSRSASDDLLDPTASLGGSSSTAPTVEREPGSAWPPSRRRCSRARSASRCSPARGSGTGSGVVIRSDGYVLTNNHVVESARTAAAASP